MPLLRPGLENVIPTRNRWQLAENRDLGLQQAQWMAGLVAIVAMRLRPIEAVPSRLTVLVRKH